MRHPFALFRNTTDEYGWMPYLGLLYLGFLFFPAMFDWAVNRAWILPTCLSVLVFLPLYLRAYSAAPGRLWIGLVVAALGFVLFPFNPFANTYVIYAAGIFGLCEPTRRIVPVAIGVMTAYTVFVLQYPYALIPIGVTWVVGLGVLVSNVLLQGHFRKNNVLRLNQEEIRQLARAAERERIARDLHDLLGHSLSVIALKSELAKRLMDIDPARARLEIEAIETAAREALSETRRAVVGMRAAGLGPELARAKLVLLSAGVEVAVLQDTVPTLPAQVETAFALALREATTNILRHAHATRCEISIAVDKNAARLRIRDNGVGSNAPRGSGLSGMAERIGALNGEVKLSGGPEGGVELDVRVPLESFADSTLVLIDPLK